MTKAWDLWLRTPWLQVSLEPGRGWVRVGRGDKAPGWSWKDTRRHMLLFSQREGYTKFTRIGHYAWMRIPREP